MNGRELTREELRLRRALVFFTAAFVAMGAGYVIQGAFADAEYPFVANSLAKDGVFAILCAIAAADVRRHGWAVLVVVAGHVLIVTGLLATFAFGQISSVAGSFEGPPGIDVPPAETLFWIWVVLATAVAVLLFALQRSAVKSRYGLRYLEPHQHATLMALAEVIVLGGDEEVLTPQQVAANVDEYLHSLRARQKWKSTLALSALTAYPLLRLRAPYPLMSPQSRLEFLERCFIADVAERRLPGFLRRPLQSMFSAAQKLTFIGYYADPRTAASTGYVPYSRRPRYAEDMKRVVRNRPSLDVRTPAEIDAETVNADVAIVGSGAAGALLAHRLAKRGREVLVLESGGHFDPSTFTEDERSQFSNLFSDGGMQMSRDARFQVLQGRCVGGTTVVNNAVCFDLPPHVLDRWNDPDGLDAGLDPGRLARAFDSVRDFLNVSRDWGVNAPNGAISAGARKFCEGVERLGLDRPGGYDVVEANIADCLGCGYCNIGCAFGKKLSALDLTLPEAQREFGTDAVRIFSECEVERVLTTNGSAAGLRCRLSDGRELRVNAKTTVVAAGALASSLILSRSGLGGDLAGRNLCFNLGVPMTAEFEEKLDSYDGLQISHYLRPAEDDGLVLETWFNPVGAQALMMPGWFSDHFRNMRRYDHLASAGSVVGSRRNATVKPGFRGRGMKLDYEPHPDDLRRVVGGLKLAGRIFLAAGATRVTPLTFKHLPSSTGEELDRLDAQVRDNTDIELHTSHPQGGNAMSRDPAKGVVDERFRVHGMESLYVCDASVFPSAITVNPQLTVMALADYAAAGIE